MNMTRGVPAYITELPCWQGAIAAKPLKGGLSNESWQVTDARGDHVVRFGKDFPVHHVDRAREAMSARAAHAAGLAEGQQAPATSSAPEQQAPSLATTPATRTRNVAFQAWQE
jgi:hypothetical protein